MRNKITRQEIEEKFERMGDYVKMGYLSDCLNMGLDFDTRKFVLVKLSGLYELSKMYIDAGKMMKNAAEINTTYAGKSNDYVKAAELFIRGGDFDTAELSVNKAIIIGNEIQKKDIRKRVKEFYKSRGKFCLDNDKRSNALEAYERLFRMELDSEEKIEIKEKLLELYDRLGKVREYYNLKG